MRPAKRKRGNIWAYKVRSASAAQRGDGFVQPYNRVIRARRVEGDAERHGDDARWFAFGESR